MKRDPDEWRRPWTEAGSTPFAPPSEAAATDPSVAPSPADPFADLPAPATDTVPLAEPVPRGEPVPLGEPVPAAQPLPLPPPSSWDEGQHGPGSPLGSVRPPDTVGTVEAPAPARRRRGGIATAAIAGLLGAVVGTGGTLVAVDRYDLLAGEAPNVQPSTAPTITVDGEPNGIVPAVAQAVTPSVVRIDILGSGAGGVEEELGLGSGVIYTSDGYIITNNHVVEGSTGLRVKLASGESLDADVVGTDPLNDLAVLKVEATGLPAINVRLDEDPVVGETAIAIGSPFGLDASVTAGVVSAVGRDIQVPDAQRGVIVIPAVIQTDAAINPGNSGGALVDARGRLMGINTAILSGSGGSQGVGFAIPVGQAILTAEQLIETGVVRHAFLGVSGDDVTPQVAERFGLEDAAGAILGTVQPGSGAAAAGLQPDDIVLAVEGDPIRSMSDLVVAIRGYQPGDTIAVTILRDGERLEVDVTLGERPDGQ